VDKIKTILKHYVSQDKKLSHQFCFVE